MEKKINPKNLAAISASIFIFKCERKKKTHNSYRNPGTKQMVVKSFAILKRRKRTGKRGGGRG